jgi:hypothetical protein
MIRTFFTSLILLFISVQVNATIISGEQFTPAGKSVSLQGLDWLSLDHTSGISRLDIESDSGFTDNYGSIFSKDYWRYATRAETEILVLSLGANLYQKKLTESHYDAGIWFHENLGKLGDNFTFFNYGESFRCSSDINLTCSGMLRLHSQLEDNDQAKLSLTYYDPNRGWRSRTDYTHNDKSDLGNLLVRESTVPEPSSLIILGVGLAVFRLTRKNVI